MPLVISDAQMDEALDVLEAALAHAAKALTAKQAGALAAQLL